MTLADLYQQVILDHAREQHGHGLREAAEGAVAGQSRQVNPLCGDEVTLRVALRLAPPSALGRGADAAGPDPVMAAVVDDVSWSGEGCSISQAATSVLHDLVVGHSVAEAQDRLGSYREMIRSRGQADPDEAILGDAVAFAGVGRHANRVKCAMLGWTAFESALQQLLDRLRATSETASPAELGLGRVPVEEAG